MSTSNPQTPQTFTRLQVPDPTVNAALQDVYNKLAQIQQQLTQILAKYPI